MSWEEDTGVGPSVGSVTRARGGVTRVTTEARSLLERYVDTVRPAFAASRRAGARIDSSRARWPGAVSAPPHPVWIDDGHSPHPQIRPHVANGEALTTPSPGDS